MNPTRLVQSIGWMAFLGVLLLGGGYANYIASWQQWVLIAATAVFGGLVLIDALVNRVSDAHAPRPTIGSRPWYICCPCSCC
jgi:hypothetical protein